jgi:hypothetical protein
VAVAVAVAVLFRPDNFCNLAFSDILKPFFFAFVYIIFTPFLDNCRYFIAFPTATQPLPHCHPSTATSVSRSIIIQI